MLSNLHEFVESMISSTKASISVILVLLYGFALRKWGFISKEGESNISKIGTTFLLPALLFSEIGPLATAQNLKTYWPIIPLSLFFQFISLLVGVASHRLGGLPRHYVPIFVFNNVTSLPLLLINALAATGSLDELIPEGQVLADVLSRGKVYILINALVGNLTRFAFGPYLIQTHKHHFWSAPHVEDPILDQAPPLPGVGQIRLDEEDQEVPRSKIKSALKIATGWVMVAFNPPLVGGCSAVFFGLIPFLHHQLFDASGWLTPIANSVSSVGNLYTALQMFVLGAHLYSKKGSRASAWALTWLFSYRFFVAPAVSIGTIYAIRTTWPGLITNDPILDFVLALSNTGPPALTLSAIAEMAELTSDLEGQISRIITLSYAVTPLISFPVTAALAVVREMDEGHRI